MTNKVKADLTINDIAKMAGVSKRTVSRVLNDSPKVNPETREKIEKIIRKTEYSPSTQARGLASKRSYLLGLFYDDPNAIFIQAVQRGILSVCNDKGYELVVHPCNYQDPNLIDQVLNSIRRSKVDGAIVLPPISADEQLAGALKAAGVKYVRLSAKLVDLPERVVVSDDRAAMKQVVDLFLEHGHRRIGIVVGPPHRIASAERLEGFRDCLRQRGVPLDPHLVVEGDFTYDSGWRCAEALLQRPDRPTAIFASNDEMAIAVIHSAQEMGIAVPEQLIVVGFDDGPMARLMRPTLTTLRRPSEKMAQLAARKLIAAIDGNRDEMDELPTTLTPHLVERDSTAEKISAPLT